LENSTHRVAGTVIGDRYQIVRVLGVGGMGEVYLCQDMRLHNQLVALKLLPPEALEDQNAMISMQAEALSAKQLSHRNIVRLNQFDISRDGAILEMEYVDGITLHERIYTMGKLQEKELRVIAEQLCSALGYAHSCGVIHRDIKPANVLLAPDPNNMMAAENLRNRPKYLTSDQYICKLTDFGISRAPTLLGVLTDKAGVSGTVQYMSPEQCKGQTTDARSDIYSLGCLLYEAAVGALPFSEGDIAQQQINEPPVPPRNRGAKISKEFEAIILKCMAKNPRQRFQKAEEIIQALRSGEMVTIEDFEKKYEESVRRMSRKKGASSSLSGAVSRLLSLLLLLVKIGLGVAVVGGLLGGGYYFFHVRKQRAMADMAARLARATEAAGRASRPAEAERLWNEVTELKLRQLILKRKPALGWGLGFLSGKNEGKHYLRINVDPYNALVAMPQTGQIIKAGERFGPLEKQGSYPIVVMCHNYDTKELVVDMSTATGYEKVVNVKLSRSKDAPPVQKTVDSLSAPRPLPPEAAQPAAPPERQNAPEIATEAAAP